MMKFKYKIKGLGSIKEAEIDIAPFTLIAGKNNTGKSFTTKSLYCILEALNDDYVLTFLAELYVKIKGKFFEFYNSLSNPALIDKKFFDFFENEYLKLLDNIIRQLQNNDEVILKIFGSDLEIALMKIEDYIKKRKEVRKFKNIIQSMIEIKNITKQIINISEDPIEQIVRAIDKNLDVNFKKNFEITNFESILNINKQKFQLEIENIGVISLNKEFNKLSFSLNRDGIKQIQKLSNVIYIDSPIYTKLMKSLTKKTILDVLDDSKFLKDYPLYIDRFYNFLEQKYIQKPDFLHLSDKIQQIINGKLEIDNNKNINFIYQGKNIPISLTAMGVTNIGIIDMLIRNNSINRGSFLIIDEPEVHLHPEWQVEFVNILYDIAKAGANVIITSHSIDIVKAVELLSKNDSENIAINKMPYSHEFKNKTTKEKISNILDDLSSPYYRMYMEGL